MYIYTYIYINIYIYIYIYIRIFSRKQFNLFTFFPELFGITWTITYSKETSQLFTAHFRCFLYYSNAYCTKKNYHSKSFLGGDFRVFFGLPCGIFLCSLKTIWFPSTLFNSIFFH